MNADAKSQAAPPLDGDSATEGSQSHNEEMNTYWANEFRRQSVSAKTLDNGSSLLVAVEQQEAVVEENSADGDQKPAAAPSNNTKEAEATVKEDDDDEKHNVAIGVAAVVVVSDGTTRDAPRIDHAAAAAHRGREDKSTIKQSGNSSNQLEESSFCDQVAEEQEKETSRGPLHGSASNLAKKPPNNDEAALKQSWRNRRSSGESPKQRSYKNYSFSKDNRTGEASTTTALPLQMQDKGALTESHQIQGSRQPVISTEHASPRTNRSVNSYGMVVESAPGAVRERGPDYQQRFTEDGDPLASCEFFVSKPFSVTEENSETPTPEEGTDLEEHRRQQMTTSRGSGLVSATAVTDAEKVVYADDVQVDLTKRRLFILKSMVIVTLSALVVSLSIVLTRPGETPAPEPVDPRCVSVPLRQRTPALECLCSNQTSEALVDEFFGEEEWMTYHTIHRLLQNVSYIEKDEIIDPTSCTPKANSVLSLALLATAGGFQEQEAKTSMGDLVHVPYLLYMIYNSLDGIHWTNATGWDTPGAPMQLFHGVNLFFLGQVTGIELPNNGLKGTIPPIIQGFSSLRVLDLSFNPDLIGTIPTAVGGLTALNELKLSGTNLGGTIPTFLSKLQRLDIFHMRDMALTGTIPSEMFTNRLRSIDLSRNQLTGSLPMEVSNSPRLQSLQLQFNQFSGSLPNGMGTLTELELLNLSINNFTGPIPTGVGSLNELEFVSFIESGVRGIVPDSFCNNPEFVRRIIGDCQGEAALLANCTCCNNPRMGVTVLCKESFPRNALDRVLN